MLDVHELRGHTRQRAWREEGRRIEREGEEGR